MCVIVVTVSVKCHHSTAVVVIVIITDVLSVLIAGPMICITQARIVVIAVTAYSNSSARVGTTDVFLMLVAKTIVWVMRTGIRITVAII